MSAQHGNVSSLPSNHDMAAMLRAGRSLDAMAASYGVSAKTIVGRLSAGGWRPDGTPHASGPPALVGHLFQYPPWVDRALCAQTDPEAFFPEKGGSTREAKEVCHGCPVQVECLDYALANEERFGIWGGTSERDRRKLLRSAPSGGADLDDLDEESA